MQWLKFVWHLIQSREISWNYRGSLFHTKHCFVQLIGTFIPDSGIKMLLKNLIFFLFINLLNSSSLLNWSISPLGKTTSKGRCSLSKGCVSCFFYNMQTFLWNLAPSFIISFLLLSPSFDFLFEEFIYSLFHFFLLFFLMFKGHQRMSFIFSHSLYMLKLFLFHQFLTVLEDSTFLE